MLKYVLAGLLVVALLAPGVLTLAGRIGATCAYAEPEPFRIGYIVEAKANLRAEPSTLSAIVTTVEKGRVFKVLAKKGQWWEVAFPGGTQAWIAGWVVTTFPYDEAPKNVRTKFDEAFGDKTKSQATPEAREAEAHIGWTGYDVVNVRKEPSTESAVLCQLAESSRVTPLMVKGDWVRVALKDNTIGWIYKNLLDFPGDRPLWVNVDAANVRAEPSLEATKLSLLTLGTKVYLLDENEKADWYKVSYAPGKTGWIASKLLADTASSSQGVCLDDGSLGAKIVKEALKFKGCRYRWGGMSSRGFDCSGLTAYVLGKFGISAPHHSGKQYTSLGKPVKKTSLKPGDLVFFNTRASRVSHVGIYIGGGKFIHAANSRRGVVINSLEEGYYLRTYVGARRVF